ncbi:hypothetical protein A4R43_02640 [Amycolatopsis albispora]|uniref:Uncharacterized protein n=1 Tax=Amycolatopsis albispora TaxID=1804986 RepID=A0A344L0H7_9PSEU|nr:hypothetical protein A4R43_02640 [Amycolatopsis albispora]
MLVIERANQGTTDTPRFLVEPPVTRIPLTVDVDLVATSSIRLQSATLGGTATGALKAVFSGTTDQPVSGWRLRIRCAEFGIDYLSDPIR